MELSTTVDLNSTTYPEWTPDEDHLDTNRVYNLPLPKLVANTDWTRSKGIAGRDVRTLRLVDLHGSSPQSYKVYPLRILASGRKVYHEFYYNLYEAKLATAIMDAFRPRFKAHPGMTMETIMGQYALRCGLPFATHTDKDQVVSKMAADIASSVLEGIDSNVDSTKDDRIRELEQELAKAHLSKPTKKPRQTVLPFSANQTQPREEGPVTDTKQWHATPGTEQCFGTSNCPNSAHKSEVEKWLKDFTNTLPVEKRKALKANVAAIEASLKDLNKVDLNSMTESLRAAALSHGMPIKLTGHLGHDHLIRCVAAAVTWAQ
jgi:hypothetical protein